MECFSVHLCCIGFRTGDTAHSQSKSCNLTQGHNTMIVLESIPMSHCVATSVNATGLLVSHELALRYTLYANET